MFNGFLRFFIFVTTLFVAWLATGRLLAATHPPDWWWLGYVQATGVELVLAYCVWLVARTTEKGLVGLMILFFGLFSISAQVLHAHFFGVELPNEANLPWALVIAWKYVLPAIPTLAGVSVGLLELAENHRDASFSLGASLSHLLGQITGNPENARASIAP
ncbi:MAG TPA: hypothetical protein VIX58_08005, partial [Anaerolineae bacterium]